MTFVASLSAMTLFIDFLLGIVYGMVGGASLAFWREDKHSTLRGTAPDLLCEGVRALQAAVALRGSKDPLIDRYDGDSSERRKGARS
jgi:hypothetical protein